MANPGYVRSTDGSDADNGSTWALANATLAGAMTDQTTGDTIYISQAHAETQATSMTITAPGTAAAMNKIVFADDAAEPPTALATTGSISTTGGSNLTINGSFVWYGGTVNCATGTTNQSLSLAQGDGNFQTFIGTAFTIGTSNTSARIAISTATSTVESRCELVNCTFKFASTSQGFTLTRSVRISGGSIDGAGSKPANLIATAPAASLDCIIERFDASNCATTFNWCTSSPAASGRLLIRNCKAPASWTGDIVSGSPAHPTFRAEAYNLDVGGSNYKFWIKDYYGSIIQEATIVRSGGATDGDTPISAKMVTNSNAAYPSGGLRSQPVAYRHNASGSSVTVTVELVTDGVTLTDKEIKLEAQYLANSGDNLSAIADTAAAFFASASNLTSSSATWTTTGLTTPTKQKLTATFTPQQKGVMVFTVVLMKASTTVYVDIQPTVA